MHSNKCYTFDSIAVTREHVPPRSFFPENLRSNLAMIVNVQQQNNNRQPPEKMEEQIARIRKRQLEGHRKAGLMDIEPTKPETKEPEPEKKSGRRAESRCDKRWDS